MTTTPTKEVKNLVAPNGALGHSRPNIATGRKQIEQSDQR